MNVKKAFTCMLTLLLVFAFFGCDQVFNPGDSGDTGIAPPPHIDGGTEPGTGENPNDTWTEITSLDGLEGTWESQYTFVEDSNGEIVSKTVVDVFTYPATGKNNVGGESEIEEISNGVKLESFIIENGERKVLYPCYYMKVDEFLKNYHPEGMWLVNKFKTAVKVKIETCVDADGNLPGYPEPIKTSSDWKKFQDMMEQYMSSGDQSVAFSEKEPYTVTTTNIYHKTSESTNPGENPDSGTNPGTGTEPGTGEKPNDTWTKITSLDGLEGTWKYAYRDFGDTSNDNIYELINTTEFILFNETGDVSASYMTDHTQEVKELSLADNRPENEIWKEIQNIYKEIPSDFSYEFTQSEPYISKSFGTIPRAGEQGFETLLIGDGTNSCTYINESKTQLKMVSILESTIYVSETGSQRPIKDDAEWEQYKAQQAPFLPEGDMFVTYSKGETYLETVTTILHKQ